MTRPNAGAVDQAALWSAALAAVISLSMGEGRYDWLSFALGAALALQIAAFYRPAPHAPDKWWDRCSAAGSFGAVSGLVAAILLAWPVQAAIGTPRRCRAAGVDTDDCAGAVAYPWLGVVWLTAAVALSGWHWSKMVLRPAPRQT
ncbi:hypothetical protein ABZ714_32855 [Streptomyces sp. NPDC006798]|uniref:hypothetical protein n=1 Tax=Streptomyces sp. NPDC006798 TaxID=3155462 RepID=UPI003400CF1F